MSPLLLLGATRCLGHQKCCARLPGAAGMKPIKGGNCSSHLTSGGPGWCSHGPMGVWGGWEVCAFPMAPVLVILLPIPACSAGSSPRAGGVRAPGEAARWLLKVAPTPQDG